MKIRQAHLTMEPVRKDPARVLTEMIGYLGLDDENSLILARRASMKGGG
jgi:hypothetical protein